MHTRTHMHALAHAHENARTHTHMLTFSREAQLSTHDLSIMRSPVVIADSAPAVVEANLHPARVVPSPVYQSNLPVVANSICGSTEDTDIVIVEAVCNSEPLREEGKH